MATLTVLLGDYPHTRLLKDGTIPVRGVDCHFTHAAPLYPAFARMVRNLEFDVCEMALATYLQAREAGVPITLLPVVMIGSTHHESLTRWPGTPAIGPSQLVGRRVGVRAYSQTTGLWVRGILREEYRIESADITWVTTEEPHVKQYRDPPNVRRAPAGVSVRDLLRDGDVAAAVLGPRAIGTQGTPLVPVIEDAHAAGQAWVRRHGTVPVNHLVVVRNDVLGSYPDAVAALYQALRESVAATAAERDESPAGRAVTAGWSEPLVRSLEIAVRYAHEQEVVRTPIDVARIQEETAFLDDLPVGGGQDERSAEVRRP
jgi:4,5-dihydroxyphthalate decarboxylase